MEEWRKQLIEDNIALTTFVVKKYGLFHDEAELSVAREALVYAALRFDPDRGYKFCTYATVCMQKRIKKYNSGPRYLIANRVNGKWKHHEVLSVNMPVMHDKDGNCLTIEDFLEETEGMTEDMVIERVNLKLFLSKLSKREQKILLMKSNGATQNEIGKACGITQVQVSRILSKLKKQYLKEV